MTSSHQLLDVLLTLVDGVDWIAMIGPFTPMHKAVIQSFVKKKPDVPVLVLETSRQRIEDWYLLSNSAPNQAEVFPTPLGHSDGLQSYYSTSDSKLDGTSPPDHLRTCFPNIALREQQLIEALSLSTILKCWQPQLVLGGKGLFFLPVYSWRYCIDALADPSINIHQILIHDQHRSDDELYSCLICNGFMISRLTQSIAVWSASLPTLSYAGNDSVSLQNSFESWDELAPLLAWPLQSNSQQAASDSLRESTGPSSSSRGVQLPRQGLDLLFNEQYYLDTYPDVAEAGVDALWHFVYYGWIENRNCRELDPYSFQFSDRELDHLNDFIFEDYYLDQLPARYAAQISRCDIIKHYLAIGQLAGLSPNPFFDYRYYLSRNRDVLAAGQDLILHYLRFGHRERRQTHPLIPASLFSDDQNQSVPGMCLMLSCFLAGRPVQRLDGLWLPWPSYGPKWIRKQQLVQWMQQLESQVKAPWSEPLLDTLQMHHALSSGVSLSTPADAWDRLIGDAARRCISGYCFVMTTNSSLPTDNLLQAWVADSSIAISLCLLLEQKIFLHMPAGFSGWLKFAFKLAAFLRDPRYFTLRLRPVLLLDLPPDLPDSLVIIRRLRLALAGVGVANACLVQVSRDQAAPYLHYGVDAMAPILEDSAFSATSIDILRTSLTHQSPWISPVGLSWSPLVIIALQSDLPTPQPLSAAPSDFPVFYARPLLACSTDLLLIGHDAFNAGAQRALLCLIKDISERNHDIHSSLLLYGSGPLVSSYRQFCPTHILLPEDISGPIEKFTQRLLLPAGDGIVCFNSLASLSFSDAFLASAGRTCRLILIIHELPCQIEGLPCIVDKILRALPVFAMVITPCHMAHKLWRQWLVQHHYSLSIFNQQDWLVMPPIDSVDLVTDIESDPETVSWPTLARHRIVGFGYDDVSFQRFRIACKRLRHYLPDAIGLWVGSGGESGEGLICYARAPVGLLLQQSDLFLLCKSYEPFGLIAAEALRLGCPVLAYHRPPIGVADWWPDPYRFELSFNDLDSCVARMREICLSCKSDRVLRQQIAKASVDAIYAERADALECMQKKLFEK